MIWLQWPCIKRSKVQMYGVGFYNVLVGRIKVPAFIGRLYKIGYFFLLFLDFQRETKTTIIALTKGNLPKMKKQ